MRLMNPPESRRRYVSVEEFRRLVREKRIRPASLEDVHGTHHQRPLHQHPNTLEWYVEVE